MRVAVAVLTAMVAACRGADDHVAPTSTSTNADSGGDASGSGTSDAPTAECGNGIREDGELCDGQPIAGHACPVDCTFEGGTLMWSTTIPSAGADDFATAIVATPAGDSFVTGSHGLAEGHEVFFARLDGDGAVHFTAHGGLGDTGLDLTLQGDVLVVTGEAPPAVFVARRDPEDGAEIWSALRGLDGGGAPFAGSVATTPGGAIVAARYDDLPARLPGAITVFDAAGAALDDHAFAGPLVGSDGKSALTYLSAVPISEDRVILAAVAANAGGARPWLAEASLDARTTWTASFADAGDSTLPYLTKPALGPDGAIAVGLRYRDDGTGDLWLGVFEPTGELRWMDRFDGGYDADDEVRDVAVDAAGRVYAAANVSHADSDVPGERDDDLVVLAYEPDGARRWTQVFTGDGDGSGAYSWDHAGAVAIDGRGLVLVAGDTMTAPERGPSAGDYDVIVRAYAP